MNDADYDYAAAKILFFYENDAIMMDDDLMI